MSINNKQLQPKGYLITNTRSDGIFFRRTFSIDEPIQFQNRPNYRITDLYDDFDPTPRHQFWEKQNEN